MTDENHHAAWREYEELGEYAYRQKHFGETPFPVTRTPEEDEVYAQDLLVALLKALHTARTISKKEDAP